MKYSVQFIIEEIMTIIFQVWGKEVLKTELTPGSGKVYVDLTMNTKVLPELLEFAREELEGYVEALYINEEQEDTNTTEICIKDEYGYMLTIIFHL